MTVPWRYPQPPCNEVSPGVYKTGDTNSLGGPIPQARSNDAYTRTEIEGKSSKPRASLNSDFDLNTTFTNLQFSNTHSSVSLRHLMLSFQIARLRSQVSHSSHNSQLHSSYKNVKLTSSNTSINLPSSATTFFTVSLTHPSNSTLHPLGNHLRI